MDNVEVYKGVHLIENDSHFTKWYKQRGGMATPFNLDLIDRGTCAIDVGAYVGLYSIQIEKELGPEGQLFSFEPNPLAFHCLCRNLKVPQSTALPFALSDTCEHVKFNLSDPNWGASWVGGSCSVNSKFLKPEEIVVATIALDLMIHAIPKRVSFIKIDAEGLELKILHGAMTLLKRDMPNIYIEVTTPWLERNGATPKDLHDLLTGLGYNIRGKKNRVQEDWICTPK